MSSPLIVELNLNICFSFRLCHALAIPCEGGPWTHAFGVAILNLHHWRCYQNRACLLNLFFEIPVVSHSFHSEIHEVRVSRLKIYLPAMLSAERGLVSSDSSFELSFLSLCFYTVAIGSFLNNFC